MALNTRISNAAAKAACDAIVDLIDGGAGAGYVEIRTGSQPADPDAAATGTLLGTLTCTDPAFGAAADATPGGEATAAAITDDSSADATGTAGYFRAYDSNSVAILDGECGTSGADMNLNTLSITIGGTISITAWTVKMPES